MANDVTNPLAAIVARAARTLSLKLDRPRTPSDAIMR